MHEKLLIVDDEKGVVDMLKSYFEMQGYTVYTAYDGETALQQAACRPDLVLLDINMPGMDGLAVCEKIRDYISCSILFLTARIETADKIRGFQAGADDYILKPFDIDELGARVAAHLRREARKQGQTELRFFSEMVIDYSKREVTVTPTSPSTAAGRTACSACWFVGSLWLAPGIPSMMRYTICSPAASSSPSARHGRCGCCRSSY